MIAWEDGRNSTDSNLEQDIYFQEVNNGDFILSDGGVSLTLFDMKQENPIISQYSGSSFIIIWEDYRSTGKEFCANLYGQSYTRCVHPGDLNGDGGWNVLDIVILSNCILSDSCGG